MTCEIIQDDRTLPETIVFSTGNADDTDLEGVPLRGKQPFNVEKFLEWAKTEREKCHDDSN